MKGRTVKMGADSPMKNAEDSLKKLAGEPTKTFTPSEEKFSALADYIKTGYADVYAKMSFWLSDGDGGQNLQDSDSDSCRYIKTDDQDTYARLARDKVYEEKSLKGSFLRTMCVIEAARKRDANKNGIGDTGMGSEEQLAYLDDLLDQEKADKDCGGFCWAGSGRFTEKTLSEYTQNFHPFLLFFLFRYVSSTTQSTRRGVYPQNSCFSDVRNWEESKFCVGSLHVSTRVSMHTRVPRFLSRRLYKTQRLSGKLFLRGPRQHERGDGTYGEEGGRQHPRRQSELATGRRCVRRLRGLGRGVFEGCADSGRRCAFRLRGLGRVCLKVVRIRLCGFGKKVFLKIARTRYRVGVCLKIA